MTENEALTKQRDEAREGMAKLDDLLHKAHERCEAQQRELAQRDALIADLNNDGAIHSAQIQRSVAEAQMSAAFAGSARYAVLMKECSKERAELKAQLQAARKEAAAWQALAEGEPLDAHQAIEDLRTQLQAALAKSEQRRDLLALHGHTRKCNDTPGRCSCGLVDALSDDAALSPDAPSAPTKDIGKAADGYDHEEDCALRLRPDQGTCDCMGPSAATREPYASPGIRSWPDADVGFGVPNGKDEAIRKWKNDADTLAAELREAKAEARSMESRLRDVVATLDRDGGHKQAGEDANQSAARAIAIAARLNVEHDENERLQAHLEECEESWKNMREERRRADDASLRADIALADARNENAKLREALQAAVDDLAPWYDEGKGRTEEARAIFEAARALGIKPGGA